jgi:hypothetical protein
MKNVHLVFVEEIAYLPHRLPTPPAATRDDLHRESLPKGEIGNLHMWISRILENSHYQLFTGTN